MSVTISSFRQLSKCVVYNFITPSHKHLRNFFAGLHGDDNDDGHDTEGRDLYSAFSAQAGHSDKTGQNNYGFVEFDLIFVTADKAEDMKEASQRMHIFYGVYGAVAVTMSAGKATISRETTQPLGFEVIEM